MLIGHFEGLDGERGIAWRGGGLAGTAAVSVARARRADGGPSEIDGDAKTPNHRKTLRYTTAHIEADRGQISKTT